ncbi:DMT family transporter [Neisseria sp. Ec49-e6-T10]|uniref:DMT family transporter n=1 Tax=Neisseria sp. Ec49-e6-T10 TaxID=3140744 RepID=UPI003EBAEBC8
MFGFVVFILCELMYFIYPLLAVLIWSINSVVNKLSAGVIEPSVISFYRWALAFLVLTPFVLPKVIKNRQSFYPHWWKLAILGALGPAIFQCLAYYAAQSITVLFMGIANAVIPLFTIFLSILVLRVIPTLGLIIGGTLSFLGLIWLVSAGHPATLLEQGINQGELLILTAAFAYALYGVLIKKWNMPISNWQSLYIQALFGIMYLLPGFLMSANWTLNAQNIPLVLFAGIPASIVAPFVWILGIHHLGADKASVFLNLAPVLTAIIAVVFLKEHLTLHFVIGGSVVLFGVLLAQFVKKPLFTTQKSKPAQITSK